MTSLQVFCYNGPDGTEGGGWTGVLKQNKTGIQTTWDPETDQRGSGSLYENYWIGESYGATAADFYVHK